MSILLSTVISFLPIIALITFVSQRNHVLMCLLSLEAVVLSLAFIAAILSPSSTYRFFCIIILSFGACEAGVALAVLVIVTRSFGSDLIKSINLRKC